MTYNQALIRASGHYLCRILPDDHYKWSDEKLNNFIMKYKCEFFEKQDESLVKEYIEVLAIDILTIINNHNKHESSRSTHSTKQIINPFSKRKRNQQKRNIPAQRKLRKYIQHKLHKWIHKFNIANISREPNKQSQR